MQPVSVMARLSACLCLLAITRCVGQAGSSQDCTGPVDPGRVTIHRINRAEYNNTIRDLLGDSTDAARTFPQDDFGYGFDNNADVLSIGPLLLEKYQSAAEQLINAAWDRDRRSGSPLVRICDPNADPGCARRLLARFGARAWRRPVASEELDRWLAVAAIPTGQQDPPEVGVKLALQAILISPHFIYRVEIDSDPQSPAPHPLSDHELAARLSYFLWSSMPDDELRAKADDSTLHQPAVIEQQVRRMLKDAKASALRQNFAGEWLYTRAVDGLRPNPNLFPGFDDELKGALRQETEMFFQSILDDNRSVQTLLNADYTFLNDRLAAHYGLPGTGSSSLVRTSVRGTRRGGILSQGSFLSVTSQPNRTSPVKRGKWVLANLLCAEPPPPPPNVPPLPEGGGPSGTLRQRMEAHRANPACATCHAAMDPIGFGLENFDAIGKWRDLDTEGSAIDSSGMLGKQPFHGAKELASVIEQDPRLPSCVVRQLFTYALGRGPTPADECALNQLGQKFQATGNRLADLLPIIASSDSFTRRHGEAQVNP